MSAIAPEFKPAGGLRLTAPVGTRHKKSEVQFAYYTVLLRYSA